MKSLSEKLKNLLLGSTELVDESPVVIWTDELLVHKAETCFNEAWKTLNSDGWKEEKRSPEGDVVHSKFIGRTHKIFKVTGTVEMPPQLLYEELNKYSEKMPSWNPTVTECRMLKIIDEKTSISYQVAAEGGGGMVKSRDFVNLRHCDVRDNIYICSGQSIVFSDMPAQKGLIRGENGPGCWVMRPIANEPNRLVFQWLLDTNLKGWIPQSIIDTALTFVMFDYLRHIRNYALVLKSQGKF